MKPLRFIQIGLAGILIINGLDKFPNILVDWSQYFPYWVFNALHVPMWLVIYGSGILEAIAGILILVKPRIGGILAALIFLVIIMSLILDRGFYNVAVIDGGLFLISLGIAKEHTS
jgi:hypothetical protein